MSKTDVLKTNWNSYLKPPMGRRAMRGAIGFYLFWVRYARLIGDRIVRYAYYLIQGGEAISLIEGSHAAQLEVGFSADDVAINPLGQN